MASERLNTLIIDDEPGIQRTLAMCLIEDGHSSRSATSFAEALDAVDDNSIDLAFVDLRLGTSNGLELIPKLLTRSPTTKLVVITAFATIETAVEAMRRGATDYLPKPFVPAQVRAVIDRVSRLRSMEAKVAELSAAVRAHGEVELTSQSPIMQRAFETARQVARSKASVLLRGESGTGKSVIARLIHEWSPRAGRPFTTISTPALSADLVESELFGHIRGAFTGASRDYAGRIAAAEGGTLFLDEIGDLPISLQPKLLHFLQEREYERVGESRARPADVRVIAATNVDLEAAVKAGRFREDLFYRLNVIQIDLPALRDRPEDIISQAERMLATIGGARFKGFRPDAIARLQSHTWPGNLRELRNVVERATIFCREDWIEADDIALVTSSRPRAENANASVSLERVEEMHIRQILRATATLDEAAQILGIDAATLWRRRKKYGI